MNNRSGTRKSSGSYYTKAFAVEYLLDATLNPALDKHLENIRSMESTDAAEAFFDFRVADIAMGSGHFLIAAIDRMEKRMGDFLVDNPLPGVSAELLALREAARKEMGELSETCTIEDGQLLRRVIARHCIYGVDLNGLAVHLTRLAVWIHTFVPGLPLSMLDHNLVKGNSLVGIATIDEIRRRLEATSAPLLEVNAEALLGKAAEPLRRIANSRDATVDDIDLARKAIAEARDAIGATKSLCDLITARFVTDDKRIMGFQFEDWERQKETPQVVKLAKRASDELADLDAFHFPIAFPEVYLKDEPGFNVIVGNPPWEKATIEEHAFWARYFPGLRAKRLTDTEKEQLRVDHPELVSQHEEERARKDRQRKALLSGIYPGMGTGDPDLYKAFCWRFWQIAAENGGRIGVVLPRNALVAHGSGEFRVNLFRDAGTIDITLILNSRHWAFESVHAQFLIGLVSISRESTDSTSIRLRGPYSSRIAFNDGVREDAVEVQAKDVMNWNDSASLPTLPNEQSLGVFLQLRKAPRLDLGENGQWKARPHRELDATNQRWLMDLESTECPVGFWKIYKGESFDRWQPDTGEYYGFADPEQVCEWLQRKRLRSHTGAYGELSRQWRLDESNLPCRFPRLAFRDVTNSIDTITMRVSLIPARVFVTHAAPYFLWPKGDECDVTFLLGVMSSIPLDWYARRFVGLHASFYIINPFPIPRPPRDNAGWARVVKLAGRLACPDGRFEEWARAVGVGHGPLDPEEKEDIIAELDAIVAHLYGLSDEQLVHIFGTFHETWNYEARLDAVLRYFYLWEGKI